MLCTIILFSVFVTFILHISSESIAIEESNTKSQSSSLLSSNERTRDIAKWKDEIMKSLKENIFQCSYNVSSYNRKGKTKETAVFVKGSSSNNWPTLIAGKTATTADLSVNIHFPSRKEVLTYRTMPSTLSAGNPKLLPIVDSPRLVYWLQEPGDRWMIPLEHPGQNKTMCVDFTKKLAAGHIGKLYDRYKKIERTFYVIRGGRAFIYPTGWTMFECGSYQGKEACETRWDHEFLKWRDGCKSYQNNHKLSWDQMLGELQNPPPSSSSSSSSLSSLSLDILTQCTFNHTLPKKVSKIFIITAVHDSNFHHLIADSLARLPRYLSFLRKNPDIMIHIHEWELFYKQHVSYQMKDIELLAAKRSRDSFMSILGIDPSRLISGNVIADRVYIPRSMSCSFPLFNPTEFRLIGDELKKRSMMLLSKRTPRSIDININLFNTKNALLSHPVTLYYQADDPLYADRIKNYNKADIDSSSSDSSSSSSSSRNIVNNNNNNNNNNEQDNKQSNTEGTTTNTIKNIVILQRQGETSSWGSRVWSEEEYESIVQAFQAAFPPSTHTILRHASTAIQHEDFCMACEIFELMHADILVGIHGAGLTKEMFMPRGGLVVEMSSHFNDVQMPVCGFYANLASIFGHHHYLYAYDHNNGNTVNEDLNPEDLVKHVKQYYDFIHSPPVTRAGDSSSGEPLSKPPYTFEW